MRRVKNILRTFYVIGCAHDRDVLPVQNELESVKIGKRTLIKRASLRRFTDA